MNTFKRCMVTFRCLVSLLGSAVPSIAYAAQNEFNELLQLPLDQIVGIKGTIVSDQKKEEAASSRQLSKISEAPATAYTVKKERT